MKILVKAPKAANVTANTTNAQIFPDSITTTSPCLLKVPGTNRATMKVIEVRASGYVTTNTTTNVTTTLYSGTSLTAGSNTILHASTARATNSTSAPWFIQAYLIFDNVSGKLHGTVAHLVNNLYDVHAAVSNVVTSVAGATEPVLNLCVGITFSGADAGNLGVMDSFILGY